MPKYTEPKDACGLTLRAVIEGELMLVGVLGYNEISDIVTAIEKRIQDGPSDWLSLSDGTTFTKTWVPSRVVEPVDGGGRIEIDAPVDRAISNIHEAHKQRVKDNTQRAQQRRLGTLMIEIQKQEETERDQQARHFARSIDLELDIAEFEDFQRDLREWRRIYVQ